MSSRGSDMRVNMVVSSNKYVHIHIHIHIFVYVYLYICIYHGTSIVIATTAGH